jgi:hypothetical protein
MRFEYFGDSYDIVKRALIQWLAPLGQWYVQPLFTDDVSPQQADAFARFLGARLIQPCQARNARECEIALEACKATGNLLVDPDTGVTLPQAGKPVKRTHLSAAALQVLCTANPDHVIVSFDQALRREAPEASLRSKIVWLAERQIAAVAFRSHASFLFCSTSADRAGNVIRLLQDAGLPEWRLVEAERGR